MQNEQIPAAGPLTAESVKLLQPGDRLKWLAEREHYGTFLHRMDDVSAGICWHSDTYGRKHYSPGFMMEFVKRPAPPKEDLGDGLSRDVEPDEAYRPHVASPASSSSVVQGDAGGSGRAHGPKCWGTTSLSDEVAHCYCGPSEDSPQPSGETREAVEELVWVQKGAGVDGDPLRATTRLGDMTAEVLLSRGTGLWNARGSHIDGRLGLATQKEGRDYAEVALRVRAKERIAAATACLAALRPAPVASSDQPEQGGGVEREWLVQIIKEHTFAADAADMILERYTPAEPAEARVRELGAMLDDVSDQVSRWIGAHDEQEARATAAEAQLAKAKEALERIKKAVQGNTAESSATAFSIASQTLAALQQAGEVE